MTRPHIIGAIARKELKEALRDRRTLFMMVLLPIVLYPALLVLVTQVAAVQMAELEEETSRVGVLGGNDTHPAVVALRAHELIDVELVERATLRTHDVVVDVSGWSAAPVLDQPSPVPIHFASVDDGSRQALDRVEEVFSDWVDAEMDRRLIAADLPPAFDNPLELTLRNQSTHREQGGLLLGSLLPIMVLLTVLMGAYYPAIDLTAGEKERSTIQTLFTAPLSSAEIVGGKYLAVVGIASISGGANLVGMALVVGQSILTAGEIAAEFDVSVSAGVFVALAWTIVLVAFFFSAVLMCVAVLARSFKEAQAFMTPVYLLCIVPAMLAQLPGVEYAPTYAFVPAVSAILLMKQLLLDGIDVQALFLVSAGTIAWTVATLFIAARLFGQESVILGERGSLRLFPRRSELTPRARPNPGEAAAWYGVLFALHFYVGATLQAWRPQLGLFITLWFVLLAPTLGVSWFAKLNLRSTFNLRPASARAYVAAATLALSALVLTNWLNGLIETHILAPPPELAEEMARFFPSADDPLGFLSMLLLIAATPAVCEELIFRGFFLSGLRGRAPDWQVALIVGIAFGLFHLSIYRLFGTAVLGVLMTWVVLRTGSVLPAILFHFINNGLAVVATVLLADQPEAEIPLVAVVIAAPIAVLSFKALGGPRRARRGVPG